MKYLITGWLFLLAIPAHCEEFKSLLKKVESHPTVEVTDQTYKMRAQEKRLESSLSDPMLQFSALNLPTSSLRYDETPMSAKQVALSQKIPLTTRLSHLGDQSELLTEAGQNLVAHKKAATRAEMWLVAAQLESLTERIKIVDDSLLWINQVDKSTQRLYSTGKTSQMNLLEIKIRRAELKSIKEKLEYEKAKTESHGAYLVGAKSPLTSIIDIPWNRLEKASQQNKFDPMEVGLQKEAQAASSQLKAAKLSVVPDLTLGAAYSFREDIDGNGDFVSGFAQISLPLWGSTGSRIEKARANASAANSTFQNYKMQRKSKLYSLSRRQRALEKELLLTTKSIGFAETEQKLATKRYSLGKLSVFELLEVEIKLRNKKSQKETLQESLRATRVEFLLLAGDDLNV